MTIWHLRSKRSPTGSKLSRVRKKRRMDRGSEFVETKIDERKVKIKRCRGGNVKLKLMSELKANLKDPKGKFIQSKILSVEKNPANPHYARRGIITKGAIIRTEHGLAKVTSRPGQDGVVNAVLIEEKK